MKIAFFGTGEFSKNILNGILDYSDIQVKLVVSQPDKEVGRKKILTKTPVKIIAEKKGIKILQPEKLKNNKSFIKELNELKLDFIIVVAYGKIIPNNILEIPKYSCINIHGSILPKYRGASPIQEAIKNGDSETGLTIMKMSEGMDEGDILRIEKISIDKLDKTKDIFKKFENIGPSLLINTLNGYLNGAIKTTKQDNSKATYCSKINKTDGEVNFQKMTGLEIFNKFKAYYPWPGIYTYFNDKKFNIENCELLDCSSQLNNMGLDSKLGKGLIVKIEKKHIGIITKDNKVLKLIQVKLEGKKSMDILSFINGNKEILYYKF